MKEDASKVVLNNNENEKMLGSHALLCAHASRDTPHHSRQYGRVRYEAGERSLCLSYYCHDGRYS